MKSDKSYHISNIGSLIATSILVATLLNSIPDSQSEMEWAELSLSVSEENFSELLQENVLQDTSQELQEEANKSPQETSQEQTVSEQVQVTEPTETESPIDPLSDLPLDKSQSVEPKPTISENVKKVTKQPERPKQEQRIASEAPSAKSTSAAALFNACLQAKAKYPTSKDARLQNPHGTVGVQVTLTGSIITSVTIVSSSGFPLLDQAARAGILSSDCGALASGMPSLTGRIVY